MRTLKSVATGYWYRYGNDNDTPENWISYYVGPDPAILPSKATEDDAKAMQDAALDEHPPTVV